MFGGMVWATGCGKFPPTQKPPEAVVALCDEALKHDEALTHEKPPQLHCVHCELLATCRRLATCRLPRTTSYLLQLLVHADLSALFH